MKYTVLIFSPRKKYTLQYAQLLEAEYKKIKKDITFEYIYISEYKINKCIGCGICKIDENKCPLKDDDCYKILNVIRISDAVIFATPVYSFNVTFILKNFLDRLSFLFFSPFPLGKKVIILISATMHGYRFTARYLKFIIDNWGCSILTDIIIINRKFSVNNRYKNNISEKMKKIAKLTFSANKKVSLNSIINFNIKKKMISKHLSNHYPELQMTWTEKGHYHNLYYYKIRINFLIRLYVYLISFIKISFDLMP